MSTDLAPRVAALEAQTAVRAVKAAYMQGLDDRLRGAVADLFWSDAVWEGLPDRTPEGGLGERHEGRAAIAAAFEAAAERMSFTAHFLTNESISVSGDRAVGRWKLLQACTSTDGTAFWQAGVYADDFECRGGEWRLAHLRLAMDFRTPFHDGWSAIRMWELPVPEGVR